MTLRSLAMCACCMTPWLAALPAQTAPRTPASMTSTTVPGMDGIASFTLANGMTFIVWPDHDIPSVALQNYVRVGSRNESTGNTGLAHFFEHMMFNGTSTHPAGDFDHIMEGAGGRNNANTSEDVTIYQDWFARSALETVMQLEADRLQHLAFIPELVESERKVVYSERRLRIEDQNDARLLEQVQATAFIAHPYQIPVIGWPSDIQHWRLEDLQQFYRTHYAPNNCVMVIAGDVQVAEVRALAERYFAPIPAQPPLPSLHTVEPQQEGERRVLIERPAHTPLLQFAYHGLAADDADFPALELLVRILAGGESSRLQQSLVEQQQLAIDVAPMLTPSFDPGLVWFMLSLPGEADAKQTEQAFDAEIARVIHDGVTQAELDKVRNQILSEFWQQLATINGKAALLGQYAVFNHDYRKLFSAAADYDKVTVAQLATVAKRFLTSRNRTVGVLLPDEGTGADATSEGVTP